MSITINKYFLDEVIDFLFSRGIDVAQSEDAIDQLQEYILCILSKRLNLTKQECRKKYGIAATTTGLSINGHFFNHVHTILGHVRNLLLKERNEECKA